MKRIVLASKSPRRQKILKENGFNFSVIPADINEEEYENLNPLKMVKTLSRLKAEKIAKLNSSAVILGADTTIDLNGKIVSKPSSINHAIQMLKELSGTTHKVITAFTIIKSGNIYTSYEITKVTFKNLTDKQIRNYVKKVDVLGFAGSYGIQDGADIFIKEIKGDYLNVVGLPTKAIKALKEIL
jgi:septum formation protein